MIYRAKKGQTSSGEAIGILLLDENLLVAVGVSDGGRLAIEGLETRDNFYRFAIEEAGELDPALVDSRTRRGRPAAEGP